MRINTDSTAADRTAMQQEMFRRIDQDGDGKVTKEEFTSGAPQGPRGADRPDFDRVFSQIDKNSDGAIDEAEHTGFLSAMSEMSPGRPSAADFAKNLFGKADADGDGKVTADEFRSSATNRTSESLLDKLFKESDADGDGVISQAELESSLSKHMGQPADTYTRGGGAFGQAGTRMVRSA